MGIMSDEGNLVSRLCKNCENRWTVKAIDAEDICFCPHCGVSVFADAVHEDILNKSLDELPERVAKYRAATTEAERTQARLSLSSALSQIRDDIEMRGKSLFKWHRYLCASCRWHGHTPMVPIYGGEQRKMFCPECKSDLILEQEYEE